MPRNTVRIVHDIFCRSCGVVFHDHNRNRAYCDDFCRLLYMDAGQFRCAPCNTNASLDFAQSLQLTASGSRDSVTRAFTEEHKTCRREFMDLADRELACRCKSCRAEAGLPPVKTFKAPRPSSGRSTDYRRHAWAIYERDAMICQICELPTQPDVHPSDDTYPTLDHVVPVGEGGTGDIENLRTAHRWCNIKRNGTPLWGPIDDESIRRMARDRFVYLRLAEGVSLAV